MNSPTNEIEDRPDSVLLLHGLGSSPMELKWLASELGKSGFTVHTPNIEGYSFGTEPSAWQGWVEACQEVLRRLRSTSDTVSVGGVSMGATLALALAETADDLTSVVALSPTLRYDGWAVPWYRSLLEIVPVESPLFSWYKYHEREPYGVKNRELRAYIKRALQQNRISEIGAESLSLRHLSQASKLCRHVRKRLDRITADTLVIHAIDDDTASPRNAELVVNGISSQRKLVTYLGDSYHMITVDNERESVSEEVRLFILDSVAKVHSRFTPRIPAAHPQLLRRLRAKHRQ